MPWVSDKERKVKTKQWPYASDKIWQDGSVPRSTVSTRKLSKAAAIQRRRRRSVSMFRKRYVMSRPVYQAVHKNVKKG